MKKSFKILTIASSILLNFSLLFSQEALKSTEEDYYDFLSLTGVVERPTLGYRTLSDSEWKFKEIESFEENEDGTFTKVRIPGEESDNNIWKNNNLGTRFTLWEPSEKSENFFMKGLQQGLTAKIYGPEWFSSYNSAAPYGQNDGALWQGRGFNTALTTGLRLEGYGFELTFKPQVSWSQNKEFDYTRPSYAGDLYKGKADTYGYYGVPCEDAPQRFGNESFWTYDWGDTEVRYTWHNITAGFGTQTIWLGPAKINPIIHSNNAPSYPKVDIGLRKTKMIMPYFGWDLGDIEFRGWWGKLSESDWFDNDDNNNSNLISGLALSYQFPFLKELTLGFNRTMLSKYSDMSKYTLFNIYVPGLSTSGGTDDSDQRVSFTVDYKMDKVGFEVFLEWGRNDFSPSEERYIRYPFHTEGWTFGAIKSFNMPFNLKAELQLELTHLECSQDYDRLLDWYTTFYCHNLITQGYTNRGQWLAAGIGTGGNSQYLGLKVYHSRGFVEIFGQRINPDLDYTMFIDIRNPPREDSSVRSSIRAMMDFGVNALFYVIPDLPITGSFVVVDEHNPRNESIHAASEKRKNFVFNLNVKYQF